MASETIADIVAEMRCPYYKMGRGYVQLDKDMMSYMSFMADRIEAAYKREREAGAEAAQICGEIGEMIGREATTEKSSRVGNAAAMREALETISKCDTSKEEDCYTLYRVCEAALSAKPRNCDIGTAEEQSERYEKFCYAHRSRDKGCGGCPLCDIVCCGFAWLQMPYEEGGAK